METVLRAAVPPLLAFATALTVDHVMARRGLLPPAFRPIGIGPAEDRRGSLRRWAAVGVLALIFWIGVFAPIGQLGLELEVDTTRLAVPQLFLMHALLVLSLAIWFCLGFAGRAEAGGPIFLSSPARQFGLRCRSVGRELALGLAFGVGAWFVVLVVLLAFGLAIWAVGGEEALPSQPPPVVSWIVALPLAVRLAVSLSAGIVEETFFRGFLQPRVGVLLSSLLFVMAHMSYDQPLMLVGIGLLSVLFALLVRWRQSIWAAIVAHAVFDAIQLLVVIPWALQLTGGEGELIAPVAHVGRLLLAVGSL